MDVLCVHRDWEPASAFIGMLCWSGKKTIYTTRIHITRPEKKESIHHSILHAVLIDSNVDVAYCYFSWLNRFGPVITITNDFPIKKTYYHCCSFSLFHIVSRIRAASWCLHCASSSKFTYIDVKLCIRKIYLMKHFIDCLFMANVVVLLLLSAADGIRKPKLKYIFYWNKFINIIIV